MNVKEKLAREINGLEGELQNLRDRAYKIQQEHDIYQKASDLITARGKRASAYTWKFRAGSLVVRARDTGGEISIDVGEEEVFSSQSREATPYTLRAGDWIDTLNELHARIMEQQEIAEIERERDHLLEKISKYEGIGDG